MWANPCRQLLRKVNGLAAADIVMPVGIFNFTGQAKVDTFAIDLDSLLAEQRAYDAVMVNKYRLSLEAIRLHANEFSYWQRYKKHWSAAGAREGSADCSRLMLDIVSSLSFLRAVEK